MQLEPELFRKVTGLTLQDFSLLVSLGVFNSDLMNDAVYKFKRYEDSSLEYTGINTHDNTLIGGWDTVIDKREKMKHKTDDNNRSDKEKRTNNPEWTFLNVGDEVVHRSWGNGKITFKDERYVIVKFDDRESKFLYPSAFEKGYLMTKDSLLQD